MSNTVNTAPAVNQSAVSKPDFGNGRYSQVMSEAYGDARRLTSLTPERAEAFARDLGSDWGRIAPKVEVSYGTVNKDGKTSLREVAKAKNVAETRSITLARLLVKAQELKMLAAKTDEWSAEVTLAVSY